MAIDNSTDVFELRPSDARSARMYRQTAIAQNIVLVLVTIALTWAVAFTSPNHRWIAIPFSVLPVALLLDTLRVTRIQLAELIKLDPAGIRMRCRDSEVWLDAQCVRYLRPVILDAFAKGSWNAATRVVVRERNRFPVAYFVVGVESAQLLDEAEAAGYAIRARYLLRILPREDRRRQDDRLPMRRT